MVVLNYTGGEINAKIVYYGPGVSGKTTNLEYIHEKTPEAARGKMVSMKTQTDRTLFFDFLPLELGEINNYRTRFLLYTVPGQVYYNATRKLVLKGVDAVVFVADSSGAKLDENLESLRNLEQNLNEHGMTLDDIPWVIQYNKRDLPDAMTVADLDASLNPLGVPTFEAIATQGDGVYETFHTIATMVYGVLKERLERGDLPAEVGQVTGKQPTPAIVPRKRQPVAPAADAPAPAPTEPRRPAPPVAPREAPEADPGPEIEFDHAVDSVLRETEAPAAPRPTATRPSPAPPKAPAAAPKPRAAAPKTPPAAPPRPKTAAPEPPAPAPVDDSLFEAIPDSPFDVELGRVPALDEASLASDNARDEGPDEFITDPMRQRSSPPPAAPGPKPFPPRPIASEPDLGATPEPSKPAASEPSRAAAPEPSKPAVPEPSRAAAPEPSRPAAPAAAPPKPAPRTAAKPARRPEPVAVATAEAPIHVPVRIPRERLETSDSVEIILDVTIVDEPA